MPAFCSRLAADKEPLAIKFSPLRIIALSESQRSKAIEIETPDATGTSTPFDREIQLRENHLFVPRKLVYTQAVLLGVTAATFFLLGLMVGNVSSPASSASLGRPGESLGFVEDCRVSGSVTHSKNGETFADIGAVVFLLPTNRVPDRRVAPGLVMPDTFEALDNPSIDVIHRCGGAVVRTDANGEFQVLVDQMQNYRLLVVSKNRSTVRRELTDDQKKTLETFFVPAEKVVRDQDYRWRDVRGDSDRVDVGTIEF